MYWLCTLRIYHTLTHPRLQSILQTFSIHLVLGSDHVLIHRWTILEFVWLWTETTSFSGSSVYLSRSTSNYDYCVHTCTRERETINHSSNLKFQWSTIFEARIWGFLEFSRPSKLKQVGSTERHYGQLLVYTERHCNIVPTCPESTLLKGPKQKMVLWIFNIRYLHF